MSKKDNVFTEKYHLPAGQEQVALIAPSLHMMPYWGHNTSKKILINGNSFVSEVSYTVETMILQVQLVAHGMEHYTDLREFLKKIIKK